MPFALVPPVRDGFLMNNIYGQYLFCTYETFIKREGRIHRNKAYIMKLQIKLGSRYLGKKFDHFAFDVDWKISDEGLIVLVGLEVSPS